MSTSVDTHAAGSQLPRLLERVEAGEEIIITRRGTPVARLVPAQTRSPVRFGVLKGQITLPGDIKDDEAEIARMFEDGDIFPHKEP